MHTSGGCGLAGSLRCQLLAGRLAARGLARGLLGTSHIQGCTEDTSMVNLSLKRGKRGIAQEGEVQISICIARPQAVCTDSRAEIGRFFGYVGRPCLQSFRH